VQELESALALAQAFAPEHLELVGAGAEALAPRATRAGGVFVGAAAGTAFGDYVAGSNHVLPTNGAARFASGLSPAHFLRSFTEVRISDPARLARAGGPPPILALLPPRGRLTPAVEARGDLQTGAHHTVEDVGICLGQAVDRALADRAGIVRYGHAVVPMDEARAACAIDISGRGLCVFEAELPPGAIGNFDHELAEEFFRAIANSARMTIHLSVDSGTNAHHMIEAAFKAFARALRMATSIDPTETGIPSTKGIL